MDTFLFCTSYLDKQVQAHHPIRYKKWLDFYSDIRQRLGADCLFMLDDASPDLTPLGSWPLPVFSAEKGLPDILPGNRFLVTFQGHLGRPDWVDYLGWWRSFTYASRIARKYGFKKIIHIESDFYVVSERLMQFIRSLNKGWTALYCGLHNFPETAIQVICADRFPRLEKIYEEARSCGYKLNEKAELLLPFDTVVTDFSGDRITPKLLRYWMAGGLELGGLDYYGQLPALVKPFSFTELKLTMQRLREQTVPGSEPGPDVLMKVLHANDLLITI